MTYTPYGYKIINAQAVVDDPIAEKVRQLYAEYLESGSMRAAAKKVGIEKTHSVIGRLLKNKVYVGTDYYPQIVDGEIFKKVQELRGSNARSQNRIKEFEAPPELELKDYKLDKVEEKYTDPYQQAEYAYSMIEEDKHE